jgi:hypothetical protein
MRMPVPARSPRAARSASFLPPRLRLWIRQARAGQRRPAVLVLLLAAALVLVLTVNASLLYRFLRPAARAGDAPALPHADLFAESLYREATRETSEPRGVVLPLYDDIALLGFSLILELRALGVTMPIEVPHCGDLRAELAVQLARRDENVRVYDACALAAGARDAFSPLRPLFCDGLVDCHARFRGFDIKVLAVVYSQFEQVMLLDADTLFFENPTQLWDADKFRETGTLFFLDRMTSDGKHLAEPTDGDKPASLRSGVGALHAFLAHFDVSPYQHLQTLRRNGSVDEHDPAVGSLPAGLVFPVELSREVRSAHAWRLRTGHFLDSSVVLWDKARQPRATAILASFVSLNGARRPPSYGDKELFFQACELAEAAYAVSDFGVGTVGGVWHSRADGIICGDSLHFYPGNKWGTEPAAATPLYINSDSILRWDLRNTELFRTVGRLAEVYPGNYKDRGFPHSCPFDVGVVPLEKQHVERFRQRQEAYGRVVEWFRDDWDDWWLVTKLELRRWVGSWF